MKQILFISCASLICMLYSCNNSTTPAADNMDSMKAQELKNLAASDVVMKAFQSGDVSGIDSVIADDFIDHSDHGDLKGRDSLKSMIKFTRTYFPDMKFDKVRDVTDGDYVYSWINYSGTSDGTMGIPKGPYKMGTIEVSKFKDGKAIEHWAFANMQDMAKMMPPPQMDKMDADKMKK